MGFKPHPFFYVSKGGNVLQKQYVGAFHSVLCDSNGQAYVTDIDAEAP